MLICPIFHIFARKYSMLSPFKIIKKRLENYRQELLSDTRRELLLTTYRQRMIDSTAKGICDTPYEEGRRLIVSLTSYGSRIHDVCYVVESLMSQTMPPNAIVLWLDESEFTPEQVPLSLRRQEKRGLQIQFCPNLRSFKKLVPSLEKFPDDVIVTVDDDMLYPVDLLERLWRGYREDSMCVYCNRATEIRLNPDGYPKPYREWGKVSDGVNPSTIDFVKNMLAYTPMTLPTGMGGVLYPPHVMHSDVTNADLFMKLCSQADDLWFKIMTLMNGRVSRLVPHYKPLEKSFITLEGSQDTALYKQNVDNNANDVQMRNILDHYGVSFEELARKCSM